MSGYYTPKWWVGEAYEWYTNTIMDEDYRNTINAEDRQYRQWVREEVNRILDITNYDRKRSEWKKLFPPFERSDDYLEGDVF